MPKGGTGLMHLFIYLFIYLLHKQKGTSRISRITECCPEGQLKGEIWSMENQEERRKSVICGLGN